MYGIELVVRRSGKRYDDLARVFMVNHSEAFGTSAMLCRTDLFSTLLYSSAQVEQYGIFSCNQYQTTYSMFVEIRLACSTLNFGQNAA